VLYEDKSETKPFHDKKRHVQRKLAKIYSTEMVSKLCHDNNLKEINGLTACAIRKFLKNLDSVVCVTGAKIIMLF